VPKTIIPALYKGRTHVTSEWLTFEGKFEDSGQNYRLIATSSVGVLEVAKNDVRIEGSVAKIKAGAIATIIQAPPAQAGRQIPVAETEFMALSGCRKTQCVGLVLICCDNGAVIGPCLGAWGC
jgi:hypothetical protein